MVKVQRLITIDYDVHTRLLKLKNVSGFINELLRKKFFNEKQTSASCDHEWSFPAATPSGLTKDCRKCGATEEMKV